MPAVLGDLESDDEEFDEAHDINVTPFIDVMLVLLIIFMVAAPLSTVDLPVDLPTSTAVPQKKPDKPTYVTIKSDLAVAIGDTPVKRVDLVRPGLLLGARSDRRPREAVAQALAPLGNLVLRGKLAQYRSIDASEVAKAIVRLIGAGETGVFAHDSPALERLATSK